MPHPKKLTDIIGEAYPSIKDPSLRHAPTKTSDEKMVDLHPVKDDENKDPTLKDDKLFKGDNVQPAPMKGRKTGVDEEIIPEDLSGIRQHDMDMKIFASRAKKKKTNDLLKTIFTKPPSEKKTFNIKGRSVSPKEVEENKQVVSEAVIEVPVALFEAMASMTDMSPNVGDLSDEKGVPLEHYLNQHRYFSQKSVEHKREADDNRRLADMMNKDRTSDPRLKKNHADLADMLEKLAHQYGVIADNHHASMSAIVNKKKGKK